MNEHDRLVSSILQQLGPEEEDFPKGIYSFGLDCGRMGSLEGIFIAEKRIMDYLIEHSPEIYFGEILGKHSEIISDDYYLELVTDKPDILAIFDKYNFETGYDIQDFQLGDMCVYNYVKEQLEDED